MIRSFGNVSCIGVVQSSFDRFGSSPSLYVCAEYSTTYVGDHGFEVSVQKQPKETKSATWTVSFEILMINLPRFFLVK